MKVHAKIQKWGNGLALRVSGIVRDYPHLKEGSEVDIEVTEDGFIVSKSVLKVKQLFPFSESQLLKGLSPELAHADLLSSPLEQELE